MTTCCAPLNMLGGIHHQTQQGGHPPDDQALWPLKTAAALPASGAPRSDAPHLRRPPCAQARPRLILHPSLTPPKEAPTCQTPHGHPTTRGWLLGGGHPPTIPARPPRLHFLAGGPQATRRNRPRAARPTAPPTWQAACRRPWAGPGRSPGPPRWLREVRLSRPRRSTSGSWRSSSVLRGRLRGESPATVRRKP